MKLRWTCTCPMRPPKLTQHLPHWLAPPPTVKVSNTVAGLATPSATEPRFELVGCYLETLPVISASMGELSTISIVFTGGVLTTATS
jgi:hypothetical protein